MAIVICKGVFIAKLFADVPRSDLARLFAAMQSDEAAQSYVALLFGETQLRQALGNLPPFDEEEIARRAKRAFALTFRLYCARAAH